MSEYFSIRLAPSFELDGVRAMSLSDPRTKIATVLVTAASFIWLCDISILTTVCIVLAIYIGNIIGNALYDSADGWFLGAKTAPTNKSAAEEVAATRQLPWADLSVSENVSDAMEQFLEQVVDRYICNWYESGISRDKAFLNEIRFQLRFAACTLAKQISPEVIAALVNEIAIPVSCAHLAKVCRAEATVDKQCTPPSQIEAEIARNYGPMHFAMANRTNEANYLRQLADHLIPRLLDDSRLAGRSLEEDSPRHRAQFGPKHMRAWPSQPARHFLRELLVHSILLPLLDLIADPDTINHILVSLFAPTPVAVDDVIDFPKVSFLRGLTEHSSEAMPDSLLQLKLSELIRDGKQFSMFRLYLEDIRGPVNELAFVAEADKIHNMMQKKTECSANVTYAIWQLFGKYVHDSAELKVPFDDEIVTEFRAACQSNDLARLERILEKSDAYLGFLCGSPPVALDIIEQKADNVRRSSAIERHFSFSQLKSRFRRAIFFDTDDMELNVKELQSPEASTVLGTPEKRILPEDSFNSPVFREGSAPIETTTPIATPPAHSKSMPDFQVPTIDLALLSSERDMPSPSSFNGDFTHADSTAINEHSAAAGPEDPLPSLVIDAETRDLGRWTITVPAVVPAIDPISARTTYVYKIEVVRGDAKPHETPMWSILRRYNEFYVLETKLNEFHGAALHLPTLPPRKTFVTKTRPFIDQHRPAFSAFLTNVCKQRQLARSDLLFAFLASNEEFRETLMLSDFNPWKVVKKVPGKLSRERGQNLQPFILSMLANALAPAPTAPPNMVKKKPLDDARPNSVLQSLLLVCQPLLDNCSRPLVAVTLAVRRLCGNTLEVIIQDFITQFLRSSLSSAAVVKLTKLAEASLFCADAPLPSDQEKTLRAELAKRRTVEFVEEVLPPHVQKILGQKEMRATLLQLLAALQFARLNKQLSYTLLDALIKKLFPS